MLGLTIQLLNLFTTTSVIYEVRGTEGRTFTAEITKGVQTQEFLISDEIQERRIFHTCLKIIIHLITYLKL